MPFEEFSCDVPRLKKFSFSEKPSNVTEVCRVEGLLVKTRTHTHAPWTDAWEDTAHAVNRAALPEGYTGERWCVGRGGFPFIVLFCFKKIFFTMFMTCFANRKISRKM